MSVGNRLTIYEKWRNGASEHDLKLWRNNCWDWRLYGGKVYNQDTKMKESEQDKQMDCIFNRIAGIPHRVFKFSEKYPNGFILGTFEEFQEAFLFVRDYVEKEYDCPKDWLEVHWETESVTAICQTYLGKPPTILERIQIHRL